MAYIMPSMGSMVGAVMVGARAGKRVIEQKNLVKFTDIINNKQ